MRELEDGIIELEENANKLNVNLDSIIQQKGTRSDELRRQGDIGKIERKLFSYFYNDPKKLKAAVRSMEKKSQIILKEQQ